MGKEKTKLGFDNLKWWIILWWSNINDGVYSNAWHLFGLHSWPWLAPKPSVTYARLAQLRIFYWLSHFLAHLKWSAYIWEVHFPQDRWKFRLNFKGLMLSDIFMLSFLHPAFQTPSPHSAASASPCDDYQVLSI